MIGNSLRRREFLRSQFLSETAKFSKYWLRRRHDERLSLQQHHCDSGQFNVLSVALWLLYEINRAQITDSFSLRCGRSSGRLATIVYQW